MTAIKKTRADPNFKAVDQKVVWSKCGAQGLKGAEQENPQSEMLWRLSGCCPESLAHRSASPRIPSSENRLLKCP